MEWSAKAVAGVLVAGKHCSSIASLVCSSLEHVKLLLDCSDQVSYMCCSSSLSDPSGADLTVAFFLLLLLLLQSVSRSSIKSHISAIWALPLTYHTSSEWGEHQGSSGGDQDDDKDTQKDKYKDKDEARSFNKKVFLYTWAHLICVATHIYRQRG